MLLALTGTTSAAFNPQATEAPLGNFLLWEVEASGFAPLESADPSKEIGVWIYDAALGVPVYVRQNPWTFFDPLGLEGTSLAEWVAPITFGGLSPSSGPIGLPGRPSPQIETLTVTRGLMGGGLKAQGAAMAIGGALIVAPGAAAKEGASAIFESWTGIPTSIKDVPSLAKKGWRGLKGLFGKKGGSGSPSGSSAQEIVVRQDPMAKPTASGPLGKPEVDPVTGMMTQGPVKTVDGRVLDANDLSQPGLNIRRNGVTYEVDGSLPSDITPNGLSTPTGKDYRGSSTDLKKRHEWATDARDRSQAKELDEWYPDDVGRRTSERAAIEDKGLDNLDNKINSPAP